MKQSNPDSTDKMLLRWLQESGRRRVDRRASELHRTEAARTWAKTATRTKSTGAPHARVLLLFGLLAVVFLNYLYADVQAQIADMPVVTVFVFARS
jgi:hypothetical protein